MMFKVSMYGQLHIFPDKMGQGGLWDVADEPHRLGGLCLLESPILLQLRVASLYARASWWEVLRFAKEESNPGVYFKSKF